MIETVRSLLTSSPVGSNAWVAVAWCLGILAVSAVPAGSLFRRRTSS